MPRLEIRRAERLSVQEISDQPITIGRSSANDVALLNLHVSRHHCVIERGDDGNIRVRDLDSVSGTWVNGDRVSQCTLFMGDRISVGPFDLVIRSAPEETGLVSRNAALESALSHVSIDEDTGIPVEGPSALIMNLQREIEQEQKRRADALAQVAELHNQIEELTRQRDKASRLNERSMLLEIEDEQPAAGEDPWEQAQIEARVDGAEAQPDERDQQIVALQEQLSQQRERADSAEARVADLTVEFEGMRRSAVEWQTYAESLGGSVGNGSRSAGQSVSESAMAREIESLRSATEQSERRAGELAAEVETLRATADHSRQADERARDLTAQIESLRSRAKQTDDVAGQIAELEGTIEIERRRAQTAETRAAELANRLEEANRVAESAEHASELQGLLDVERDRVDSASVRLSELESHLAETARQREGDLARIHDLIASLGNTERLLAEASASVESVEADRSAALRQLEDAQAELARWRSHGEDAARALETEQAHAADLNRALEEAWRRIEETADRLRATETRLEDMEAISGQASERAAEALGEHLAEIERLTSSEADLRAQLENASSSREPLEDIRSQLETAKVSLHHALARADELEKAADDLRARVDELEEQLRTVGDRHDAALAVKDKHIHDLRTTGEQLRQRLNSLEATKYAAAEKAERALKTLNVLHGQIRSLDEATAKVTDLQSRLAQVEAAWVQTDESLETADGENQDELQVVVQQRQQIGAELDELNKARDAAVASLRDSAMRLRSLSERETPTLISTVAPQKSQDPGEPVEEKAGSGRKWWKFGG